MNEVIYQLTEQIVLKQLQQTPILALAFHLYVDKHLFCTSQQSNCFRR